MKCLNIALSCIFVHSLISLGILYLYTSWILQENTHDGYGIDVSGEWDKDEPLQFPHRVKFNALSSWVQAPNELSIRGWWLAHEKWTAGIECLNKGWGTCVKVFSTTCRVDSVRSIYQWIPIRPDAKVTGFELSLRSVAVDLHREAADALYGCLALARLSDGSIHTVAVEFPEDHRSQHIKYKEFVSPINATITSITLMLSCYGFSGTAKFTDIALILKHDEYHGSSKTLPSLVVKCPHSNIRKKHKNSSYRLELLNSSTYNVGNSKYEVTLVTQLSMDRLSILQKSLSSWEGPVSLAVYIPSLVSAKKDLQLKEENDLQRTRDWQRLYVQKKLQGLPRGYNVHATLVYETSANAEIDYPINYLRNVAIKHVKTNFIFLVDADFSPAPEFQSKFDVTIRGHEGESDTIAWVVPAFEYLESPGPEEFPPITKEDLAEQVLADNSNIQPFRLSESPESHRLTDYWQWYRAEHPYDVLSYNDKYEPYIILKQTNRMPFYDERFTGYGMNKVSHITELFASGYKFKVLHDLWALHFPHRTTPFTVSFLQNPQTRLENRADRFEFIGELMAKYNLGDCGKTSY